MPLIDKNLLEPLVNEGRSWSSIAKALNESEMRVRYACERYGLKTKFQRRKEERIDLANVGLKRCTTCEPPKSIDQFDKDPRASDGLSSQCKACRVAIITAWQATNYQRVLDAGKRWKDRNPDRVRAYSSWYWQTHKEERKAYLREWFNRHPEMNGIYRRQREARRRGAKGYYTREQLKSRIDFYGGLCWICKEREADTIDHVKPLNKGGSEWPANLRPACHSCNSSKQDKWPLDITGLR